jgi:hypothetical protein
VVQNIHLLASAARLQQALSEYAEAHEDVYWRKQLYEASDVLSQLSIALEHASGLCQQICAYAEGQFKRGGLTREQEIYMSGLLEASDIIASGRRRADGDAHAE